MGLPPHVIETWPGRVLEEFRQLHVLEPWGPERDNWHAAIQAQLTAAVHTKRNRKPPSVSDFMYKDPYTRHDEMIAEADSFFFPGKGHVNGKPS